MNINFETSGMKRSLHCMDLIAMESPEDNHLMRMMSEHLKKKEYSATLAVDVTAAEPLVSSSMSFKKRRVTPPPQELETPATKALEDFLRFAAADETSATPQQSCIVSDVEDSDCDEDYLPATMMLKTIPTFSPTCSLLKSNSTTHHLMTSGIHEVTRGIAQISASH